MISGRRLSPAAFKKYVLLAKRRVAGLGVWVIGSGKAVAEGMGAVLVMGVGVAVASGNKMIVLETGCGEELG